MYCVSNTIPSSRKNTAFYYLPHFLHERLAIYNNFDWFDYLKRYWYVFIYSAAIGVFSHLFWDSFTHDTGLLGKSPYFLGDTIPYFNMKLYEFLQLLSTLIGGLYILLFLQKIKTKKEKKQPILQKVMFWINAILIMSVIFIINSPQNMSDFIATTIGSFLYGIVGSSIYYFVYEKIYSSRSIKL